MQLFARVLALFALYGVVISHITPHSGRKEFSSTAQPVDVPYDINEFSLAAALAQQPNCNASSYSNGDVFADAKLLYRFGDGNMKQHCLIYHSQSLGVTVSFQGTNGSSLVSTLHDFDILPVPADARYRKYMPDSVRFMDGFQRAYTDLVDVMFEKVKEYKKALNETRVSIVGHSLGAAIGLIASVDVEHRMDDGLYRTYLFGLPRAGNVAWANHVDKTIGKKLHWVVNGRDWVPHVAIRIAGYQHPSNYVWIYPANSTIWKLYPGQENVHGFNSVPLNELSDNDHRGIYFGTQVGGPNDNCPAEVGKHN